MCTFPEILTEKMADEAVVHNVRHFLQELHGELASTFNSFSQAGISNMSINPAFYFSYRHIPGIDTLMSGIAADFKDYLVSKGYTVERCEWHSNVECFIIWIKRKKLII